MRLNKYIASAGVCSRRKADELTQAGKVKVNGAVCTVMGYDVQPGDRVEVNGKLIEGAEALCYYVLNKPLGYITTLDDEFGRPTAVSLLTDVTARVFPVGRLDANTTGLLIMTNDGKLSYHISHPSQKVWKTYIATIDDGLTMAEINQLKNGVDIGGYTTKPANIKVLKGHGKGAVVEVQISEGKNHQVRKMFKAIGKNVLALERTAIGEIKLGRLKLGGYRRLTPQEVEYLKNC